MCQCVEILLPLLKSSCVPVLAAGLATKDGRGRGVARTRRHESRLLASTSLIAAPAHVTRVRWVSPAQLVSTCLYRFCWGTYISCSINCVPSPSETPATAQLHETGTRALLSSICRVQILFRILISLSENEQNNKSCCIPLQST